GGQELCRARTAARRRASASPGAAMASRWSSASARAVRLLTMSAWRSRPPTMKQARATSPPDATTGIWAGTLSAVRTPAHVRAVTTRPTATSSPPTVPTARWRSRSGILDGFTGLPPWPFTAWPSESAERCGVGQVPDERHGADHAEQGDGLFRRAAGPPGDGGGRRGGGERRGGGG